MCAACFIFGLKAGNQWFVSLSWAHAGGQRVALQLLAIQTRRLPTVRSHQKVHLLLSGFGFGISANVREAAKGALTLHEVPVPGFSEVRLRWRDSLPCR